MTNQILGALELGLVYGLMVLGVFITFRILKVPDLTVDGSITLGMAVCAMLTNAGHPGIALIVAMIAARWRAASRPSSRRRPRSRRFWRAS